MMALLNLAWSQGEMVWGHEVAAGPNFTPTPNVLRSHRRFDPTLPPGVGPRGGQGRREDRIRGIHDAGKPKDLPDNNMFM